METQQHYLQFSLGEESVFVPLKSVKVVLALPALQSVPNQDQAFCGVLNFHGKGVAVYDLLNLINSTEQITQNPDTPLLLICVEEQFLGFLVTEVAGLVKINKSMKQSTNPEMMPYISYIVESEHLTGWVLNPDKLATHCRLILNVEAKHE